MMEGLTRIFNNLPNQLTFFVTSKCNSRCIHCFYKKSLNKSKDELTLDEIEKISKGMDKLYWLFISGGEPFLRDDLSHICKLFYCNNKVKSIVIPTNALLPEKIADITENILISCEKSKVIINLSVDGLYSVHDKIRGIKGNFRKLLKTHDLLQKLRKYDNFAIGANITCCEYNQEHLMKIYSFLKNKLNLDNINLSLIRGVSKINVNMKYYEDLSNSMGSGYDYYSGFVRSIACAKENMMRKIIIKVVQEKKQIIECYAGRTSAVMDEVGNVYPCEMLPKVGNLREYDYDFKKIWNNKKMEKIRESIKNKECFCTHECFISNSILSNPRMIPSLLKEMVF